MTDDPVQSEEDTGQITKSGQRCLSGSSSVCVNGAEASVGSARTWSLGIGLCWFHRMDTGCRYLPLSSGLCSEVLWTRLLSVLVQEITGQHVDGIKFTLSMTVTDFDGRSRSEVKVLGGK